MKSVFNVPPVLKGIKVDPRTKLFLLLAGNLTVLFSPSLLYEGIMAVAILIFGLLCGVPKYSVKMSLFYFLIIAVQLLGTYSLPIGLGTFIAAFAIFIRKIFPCVMLGGILVSTTKVSEFMAAMNRMHLPKTAVIPLTVMLRYFPMVGEEWSRIKDAMRMRGVSPSIAGFLINPSQTMECIYVPLLLSASRIADELSAAAVTRGIEYPGARSSHRTLRYRFADGVFASGFAILFVVAVFH